MKLLSSSDEMIQGSQFKTSNKIDYTLDTPKPSTDSNRQHRADEKPVLHLVKYLCHTLESEGIQYCHWKSNAASERSASGDNDLDLLVSRADAQRFTETLFRLGFKEARHRPDKQLPGLLDYYGYDQEADRFIHVHVHYQLILGHDAAKNYRLPIEGPYLASAFHQDTLFKVPTPEFEYIVYIIRMVLKHSTWDTIIGFEGALSKSEQRELTWLSERIDQTLVRNLLEQYLPFLDIALFEGCVGVFQPGCSTWYRMKVGAQLRSHLKAHARRSIIVGTWLKFWRRGVWGIRRFVLKQSSKKRLNNGGVLIALVGGDGSGKSTAIKELYSWLSKNFNVERFHLGKPRMSPGTLLIKGMMKVGRWIGLFSNNKVHGRAMLNGDYPEFPGYLWLLRHVLNAHDRYRTYMQARRAATNGSLVICDRYPLPEVKFMDGERTTWLLQAGKVNQLAKCLARLELSYYQHILPPDLLVVLRVDPEIAVQRKPDEDTTMVQVRNREIREINWQDTPFYVIDAGEPKEEVLDELKNLVWSKI